MMAACSCAWIQYAAVAVVADTGRPMYVTLCCVGGSMCTNVSRCFSSCSAMRSRGLHACSACVMQLGPPRWKNSRFFGTHFRVSDRTIPPGLPLWRGAPDVAPSALVLGFLLAPHELRVGVLPQHAQHDVVREGRDLLEAHEHDVGQPPRAPRVAEVVVDLPAAEDHAHDVGGGREVGAAGAVAREVARVVGALAVVDHAVEERAGGEVPQRRRRRPVVVQELGGLQQLGTLR